MSTITSKLAEELKGSLPALVVVVTSQSEKYEESIKRWSSAAEKPAVRFASLIIVLVSWRLIQSLFRAS
jgi:hypothetical protein